MNTIELNYEKLEWLTDSSGDIHEDHLQEIPNEVKEWFEPVAANVLGSYPYLVRNQEGQYGLMAVLEYVHPGSTFCKECYDDVVKGTYLATAKDGKPLFNHLQNFAKTIENEMVFVSENTGFGENHELSIFVPAFTPIEKVKETVNKIEQAEVLPKTEEKPKSLV